MATMTVHFLHPPRAVSARDPRIGDVAPVPDRPRPPRAAASTRSSAPSTTCRSPSTTRCSSSPRRPDRRLRMHQLADQVAAQPERRDAPHRPARRTTARSSATRALSDARGAEAVLTAAGLDRLRDASRDPPPRHLRPLRRGDRARPTSRPSTGRCATSSPTVGPRARWRIGGPADDRAALRRDERLRLPGLVAALLPAGAARRRPARATTRTRLTACELNNTFYQQPTPAKVDAWLAATPPDIPVRGQGPARRRRSARSRSTRARACRG